MNPGVRVAYVVEVVAFAAIVIADAFGLVPITQTIFLLPLIWVLLKIRRERWASIGFSRPANIGIAVAVGVTAGILTELFAVYITTPRISQFFGAAPTYEDLRGIQDNIGQLAFFIVLSWVLAAFGEEICFRGFLMKRVALVLGESQFAWIVSLVATSVLFGWGHTEQGASGWVQEGLSGLLLGILFLANDRKLFVPIVAHGVSNTLAFVLMYFGRYPGMS